MRIKISLPFLTNRLEISPQSKAVDIDVLLEIFDWKGILPSLTCRANNILGLSSAAKKSLQPAVGIATEKTSRLAGIF